jgi:ATP-dependent exoDNAse (exonuclease V) beta subunit
LNAMNTWLNDHPFILTTLDAKGLEFEDVVVAFDVDRKAWAIKDGQVSSLRLLRELYVAITRAKRRVVILIKRNVETMRDFFSSLEGCNIVETDAKTAFLEFDSTTSSEQWFELGKHHFEVLMCYYYYCLNLLVHQPTPHPTPVYCSG